MSGQPIRNLFVSYARADAGHVRRFLDVLNIEVAARKLPVNLWRDEEALQPGVSWLTTIAEAIENSVGLLLFVSPASMKSDWVRQELHAIMGTGDRLVVPVILEHVPNLPAELARVQWLDISPDLEDDARLRKHAARLAEAIESKLPAYRDTVPLSRDDAKKLAELTASGVRESAAPDREESSGPPNSVFVVHGHDLATRDLVCDALSALSVEPIVLSQSLGQSQSLLQKFLGVSKAARFAVVVLTADDYGASLLQYDEPGVADRALQYRARQNVVLELGFFYGHLGWENVFVLYRKAPKVFPNFERPSDLEGAVFDEIDDHGRWRSTLASKLKEVGFVLSAKHCS